LAVPFVDDDKERMNYLKGGSALEIAKFEVIYLATLDHLIIFLLFL